MIEQEGIYNIVGILDDEKLVGNKVLGYKIVGTDRDIGNYVNQGHEFLITVGQIGNPVIRKKIYALLQENKAKLATIISPRSYVSKHAEIGKGTIVMHDAVVNAAASIGDNCIVNSKALIEHDAVIENFCHVSTAAVINGGVTLKEGVFFGSNAVCKEEVVVGNNDFVKAGSVFKGSK